MRKFNFFRLMLVLAVLVLFWMNEQGLFDTNKPAQLPDSEPYLKDSSLTQLP
jgi:hypothetical protein